MAGHLRNASLVLLITALSAAPASAGSIDLLSNLSADYIRTFSRNASIDGVDAVAYNPAGTSFFKQGLHLSLHSQTIFKEFKITYKGEEYAANDPSPIVPSVFIVYTHEFPDVGFDFALSAFGAFTIPAGGGSLTYPKGVPFLEALALKVDRAGSAGPPVYVPTNGKFEGSSMFLAPTVGMSFRFLKLMSFSLAARVVIADKSYKGSADYGDVHVALDAEKSAVGAGVIAGLFFQPIEQLRIGLRYESETVLNFKTKSTLENFLPVDDSALESFGDGAEEKRNLPHVISIGVAGDPIPELTLSWSANLYLTPLSDSVDDIPIEGANGYTISYDDDYKVGFDLAFAVEGHVIPELTLSAGYNHSDIGGNKDTFNDFEFALNSDSLGLGGKIHLLDNKFHITVAFAATFYTPGRNDTMNAALGVIGPILGLDPVEGERFDKSAYTIAIGIEGQVY